MRIKNWPDSEMATQHPSDFQLPYTEYALNGQNGRINFSTVTGGPEGAGGTLNVPGFDYGKKAEVNFVGDMLRGNMTPSEVAMAFFTTCNVETIQQAIRREVYIRSGPKKYTIDDQDVDELKMVMRGMYYQYAKNNTFDSLPYSLSGIVYISFMILPVNVSCLSFPVTDCSIKVNTQVSSLRDQ
jgi:hypothetical protein